MPNYVIDAESDGLLDTVTKIHVIGWHNLSTGKCGAIVNYEEAKRFLTQPDLTLICHNIHRFDVPLFERILGIKINARIIDTLALSHYLEPYRESHGLGSYGEEFGVPKPEVTDWSTQSLDVYINRVTEDVKINVRTFIKHFDKLKQLYDTPEEIKRAINYICYKYECAREQEEVKWKLDIPFCTETLEKFEVEYDRRELVLSEIMPEYIKYKTLKKPKVMTKKDGSISKSGENWLFLLADLNLDDDYDEVLRLEKSRDLGNPKSPAQLKAWLYDLGWTPVTFKYEKTEDGKMRKIEQISLPRGEGLCPSVKRLYEVEPRLEELDMLYVIKHRIGLLKGFLRDQVDGYLQAKIAGLTNTLRFKHSVVVNLPGVTKEGDWRDGCHIRGCLIAPEGHILCGSDMSSLENRTGEHYMYFFDPDYVEERNAVGFDSHLDMAITAGMVTEEDVEFYNNFDEKTGTKEEGIKHHHIAESRSSAKTVNYSAIYGVGAPKMHLTTGMPLDKCVLLLKAYWDRNWSVKEVAKTCEIKYLPNGEMWLFNPVSKFWYSLRYLKDRFSTLNQGTGVYIFDTWVRKNRQKGIKMCGQFHDEVVTILSKGQEEDTERILRLSIKEINNELGLNRDMDIDVKFGLNYSQIH